MLNLKTLLYLYQRFLDHPNIIYTIAPIISSGFEDFNFLILLKISGICNIEKIMIFVNSIEKNRALVIYLWTFLLDKLKDRGEDIIKSLLSILKTITKSDWLEKFLTSNTRTIICINIIGIRVDILNIKCVIQSKIIDCSIFTIIL